MNPYYITTPIYYVNDRPHLGHAYCTLACDTLARFHRLMGRRVHFLTGTDEHGQKVQKSAEKQGITPQALADSVVTRYQELWKLLSITHDDFIRTTEARHHETVLGLFRAMQEKGDIYKDSYEGWYCSGCEAFIAESQVQGGKCPEFGHPVERLREESYFFRLSAYQEKLLALYKDQPAFIQPDNRRNEIVSFVQEGLKDLSISRTSITWGIPVPGDGRHVIYVWLDALSNYVSALGYGRGDDTLYSTFWPADVHVIGKDILRFHAVYWPAFLMSAGLPLPKQVFGHGWWLKDERKMSKSLGNIVAVEPLVEAFGADALRYFVLREVPFGQDGSFSEEALVDRLNGDLANGLGNLFSRVHRLLQQQCGGHIPKPAAPTFLAEAAVKAIAPFRDHLAGLRFREALDALWGVVAEADRFLVQHEPWKAAKDPARAGAVPAVLYEAAEAVRIIAALAQPFLPDASAAILAALTGRNTCPLHDLTWGGLHEGQPTAHTITPLFPRVDKAAWFAAHAAPKETTVTDTPTPAPAPSAAAPAPTPAAAPGEITYDQFSMLDLRVGTVKEAERVPKSKKLVRLMVDLGEAELRQIVAGIGEKYAPEELLSRQIVVVANLKPARLMGVESRGMLLAASLDGLPILASFGETIPNGTKVK